MALLSSRGISTPSLQAQGGQRRSSYFNNDRDIAEHRHGLLFPSEIARGRAEQMSRTKTILAAANPSRCEVDTGAKALERADHLVD
jgi:hypothetical protein